MARILQLPLASIALLASSLFTACNSSDTPHALRGDGAANAPVYNDKGRVVGYQDTTSYNPANNPNGSLNSR